MSTGDVIDRAVRLYRRNFTPLIAIAAVPTLIGYAVGMMFYYGYANAVLNAARPGEASSDAVAMMLLGLAGYPVWGLILLLTVCGLARAVGDNLMLGEPITFRRCFASVRGKFGSIILLGLIMIALMVGLYVVAIGVLFALALIITLVAGLIVAMHLPQWAIVILVVMISLIVLAAGLFVLSFILARVVFLPQVLMIEGETVGSALGRAFRLGKGNWNRVLAIMLFAFAVQALAVIREAGLDPQRINPNGGAIALGHPLGCTGAKLTATVLREMERSQTRYGMVTMCIGGGQGAAGIFERLS